MTNLKDHTSFEENLFELQDLSKHFHYYVP